MSYVNRPVYRQTPKFEIPISAGENTHISWYRWFQSIDTGQPPNSEVTITPTASPFTYVAPARGFLIVTGGTVSVISFTRVSTYVTGQTGGTFPLSLNDKLTVTYSVAPTMTWVPQ